MNQRRNQQILGIISKLLDPHSFSVNQYLVSRLTYVQHYERYAIAISDLMLQPDLASNHESNENIIEALTSSQSYYLFKKDNKDYLVYPYQIFPHILVLKQINELGSRELIISYLNSLNGTNTQITIHDQKEDMVVTFPTFGDCMAFWRGMKYIPYNNHYIEGEIFSQTRSFVLSNPEQLNETVNSYQSEQPQQYDRNSYRNQQYYQQRNTSNSNHQNSQYRDGQKYKSSYRNRPYREQNSYVSNHKIPIKKAATDDRFYYQNNQIYTNKVAS